MIAFRPLVMSLAALLGLVGCDRAEPETYLLPSGYTGAFYVVQGRSDGVAARVEDGRRVYEIPASGLLVTQATANTGKTDERFYYVLPDGARREVTERVYSTLADTPESRADPTVVVYDGSAGSLGADEVPYRSFSIGTRAQILDAPDRSDRLAPFARPTSPGE